MAFCLMPLTCTFDVSAITLPEYIMVSATCFLEYGYQNLDQTRDLRSLACLCTADKPPLSDLRYFLDFQAHKLWAPMHSDLPLGPISNRSIPTPALTFTLMGPELFVNSSQVCHFTSLFGCMLAHCCSLLHCVAEPLQPYKDSITCELRSSSECGR